VRATLEALHAFYGPLAHPPADLFGFFVWEVISDAALPARRDLAWQALKRIPALTPDAMFRAPAKALHEAVGHVTHHRDERIDMLKAGVGELRRDRDLPQRMTGGVVQAARAVWRLPHLDAASRARALLFVGGYPVLPVDQGTARVVERLTAAAPVIHGLRARVRRARRLLAREVPPDVELRRQVALYFAHHAARACTEVSPHCQVCPLLARCAHGRAATA
jgi:endonuclease III